jgi:tetratricopeptide (TPR) repeat protein
VLSSHHRFAIAFLAIASATTACSGRHEQTSSATAPAVDSIRPPTRQELATGDGGIAMGNLEAQIEGTEDLFHRDPKDTDQLRALVNLISTRAQYTSKVADLEKTLELADELVKLAPDKPESYETRGRARSGLHLFKLATEDFDEALKHGGDRAKQSASRASVLQAEGDLDGAMVLRESAAAASPDISTLVPKAELLGELDKPNDADLLFRDAWANYKSVSPFPIAWLLFQEASMWEKQGNVARAKAFYEAAYERLPAYAHAASHLAALESPSRAVEILTPIVATADDPEFELVMARALVKLGDASAKSHFDRVAARYDELVAKHPEAYRDHAAAFFLTEGDDPKKALELSKQALNERKISTIYETALLAAIRAGANDDACALAKEVDAMKHPSSTLREVAKTACK